MEQNLLRRPDHIKRGSFAVENGSRKREGPALAMPSVSPVLSTGILPLNRALAQFFLFRSYRIGSGR